MKPQPKKFYKSIKSKILIPVVKRKFFPRISLIIPEKVFARTLGSAVFLTAFCCGFIFMAIGIVGFNLKMNLINLNTVKKERAEITTDINYWKGFVDKHQGYRDGYYQLAILEYRLGNQKQALDYLGKTLEIDPNFSGADLLMEKIKEKR
jgi:tetratricopeptide (TPR) repeat protein